MKYSLFKKCMLVAVAAVLVADVSAQRTGRNRNNSNNQNQGNQNNNTQNQQQQVNNNQPPVKYDPYGGVPIEVDSSGVSSNSKKTSLRQDNAFDKKGLNARTPLDYEHLRWDDALYAEKVWRELDLREKMNQTFRYEGEDDNGSQVFINILLNAVTNGDVTAFADDRFTTPITVDDINQMTLGSADTVAQYDPNDINKIVKYVVTRETFNAKNVLKLRIKEEWVFDREASRMFCRILGVSPVLTKYLPSGQEFGSQPMFWVYYPDLRATLAKNEVYNPKNMGQSRMTWEELFESRMFSSYITKSTLDNAANKTIRQVINDPILRLLEGENIKEKIFNFEQDLWSY